MQRREFLSALSVAPLVPSLQASNEIRHVSLWDLFERRLVQRNEDRIFPLDQDYSYICNSGGCFNWRGKDTEGVAATLKVPVEPWRWLPNEPVEKREWDLMECCIQSNSAAIQLNQGPQTAAMFRQTLQNLSPKWVCRLVYSYFHNRHSDVLICTDGPLGYILEDQEGRKGMVARAPKAMLLIDPSDHGYLESPYPFYAWQGQPLDETSLEALIRTAH